MNKTIPKIRENPRDTAVLLRAVTFGEIKKQIRRECVPQFRFRLISVWADIKVYKGNPVPPFIIRGFENYDS